MSTVLCVLSGNACWNKFVFNSCRKQSLLVAGVTETVHVAVSTRSSLEEHRENSNAPWWACYWWWCWSTYIGAQHTNLTKSQTSDCWVSSVDLAFTFCFTRTRIKFCFFSYSRQVIFYYQHYNLFFIKLRFKKTKTSHRDHFTSHHYRQTLSQIPGKFVYGNFLVTGAY